MEDPSHYPRSTGNNSRRRDRTGGNIASENPSAQETNNGPRQSNSSRRRVKQDKNPEGPKRDYKFDQRTAETI
jgi:hypothetical protein